MSDIAAITAGLLCIAGSLYAINARQLMRGVLGLAVFFIGIASFFGLLGAWYLAAGQVFLFVGGVVTLFVLAFNSAKTPQYVAGGAAAAFAGIAVLAALGTALAMPNATDVPTLGAFALGFFTSYGWVLNVTILLLFSAIITAQYLMEDR